MYPRQRVELPVIFLAFAAVSVEGYLPLPRLAEEAAQLREICEAAQHAGKCELILRENVTLTQILDTFQRPDLRNRIAVFHFSGHADGYELLLQEAAVRKLLVDGGGLAAFLAEQEGLKFVFLNACSTQAQVLGLHAAGVKSVLATTEDVRDDEAMRFAVRFYKGFISGASLISAFRASVASERALRGEHTEFPWRLHLDEDQDGEWTLGTGQASVSNWRVPFLRDKAFVGRELDLENIHAQLMTSSNADSRTLVLTGMGGIGKTQLAVEYCYRYVTSYPDGVFWINAAADWQDEFAELGAYIEPTLAGEPKVRRIRACADYLNAHPNCLLVLDNVHEPGQIRRPVTPDLIPAGFPCRLLLTTRLHYLADVRAIEVTVLPEQAALQLLLRHECRLGVFDPSHPEHAEAKRICAIVGYLPLALAIAGAHVGSRSQLALAVYRQHLLDGGALTILDNPLGGVCADDLATRHEAAIAATLAEQWNSVGHDTARLLLRVVSQLPEAAVIPIARLGLLSGVHGTDDNLFGSSLELAVSELRRLSLLELLHHAEVRCHPLVCQFAANLTSQAEAASFRRDCAKRLSDAYKEVLELERQCALRGVDAVEQDLRSALDLLQIEQALPDTAQHLRELLRMVQLESHTLRGWNAKDEPMRFLQQWRKRTMISLYPQQAQRAEAALSNLAVPYISLQWTTVREPTNLLRTLDGHSNWVVAVAVTPDGRRAVSGSHDHTVKVWDLDSGRELLNLEGHSNWVVAVAVTPDGRQVVSTSRDNTLKVWDLESGRELQTLYRHSNQVASILVTPNGMRGVSSWDDGALKVWDLESGRELQTLEGHSDSMVVVAVTPDGRRAVSGSLSDTLKVWDLESGRELHTLDNPNDWVVAVAVTPDGRRGISGSYDGTLKVWDLESGHKIHTLGGHSRPIKAVAVTPDGRRAVSSSEHHTLKVWDLESGRELHTLSGHSGPVGAVTVTPDGRRVISASNDGTLKVWDLESGHEVLTLKGHARVVYSIATTPDGRRLVSASDDHTLKVWDLESGRELHTLKGHSDWVVAVAVTPDGKLVVSGSYDHTLKVWDLESGHELHTLEGHTNEVYALVVTPYGRCVVSASQDKTLKVWDLESGRDLHTLVGHNDWVVAVAVTPDGRRAVSGSYGGTVKVWDLESGRDLHTLEDHDGWVVIVAVIPGGKRAVFALDEETLEVWDLESMRAFHTPVDEARSKDREPDLLGESPFSQRSFFSSSSRVHTQKSHLKWLIDLAVTPDGLTAASTSAQNDLKVWSLETLRVLTTINLDDRITCISFAPDNQTIIAGDTSGNIHCLRYCEPRKLGG